MFSLSIKYSRYWIGFLFWRLHILCEISTFNTLFLTNFSIVEDTLNDKNNINYNKGIIFYKKNLKY